MSWPGDPHLVVQTGLELFQAGLPGACSGKIRAGDFLARWHPKDINLYQSQKGLAHAAMITRPGRYCHPAWRPVPREQVVHITKLDEGKIVLVEVWGVSRLKDFNIGPHKGYQMPAMLQGCVIVLF